MRNIFSRLIGTSVHFNGLFFLASTLQSVLARYVANLFIWNDHAVYKVSLVGSAARIRLAGRYYFLCTNHQLRGRQLENVSMMSEDGQRTVTSSGVRHFHDDSHPAYLDLAVFDFTEPCHDLPEFQDGFDESGTIPPDAPNTDILFAVVAGFPSKDQLYELEDKNHIGKRKRIVVCTLDAPPSDPALICLRTIEPRDFDPDRMSGGSAFVVQCVRNKFHAFLAGIVVTGGTERFHIIKVGYIDRVLRTK